jgi:glucose/arabinose dehydrogenase
VSGALRAATFRASSIIAVSVLLAFAAVGPRARTAGAVDAITLSQLPNAAGLIQPVALTHAGDDRLFIVEQDGRIRVYENGNLLSTPFLAIEPIVRCCGEEGLLSVAFHPNYPATPYFYVNYTSDVTGSVGDAVIARYTVSADPNVADASSALIMKVIAHPGQSNHNGGQLAFGPDGMLYFGMGDGGGGGDPNNNAQNINTLLGKLLRLNVDAPPPYIAAGNPYEGATPGLDEIWAIGLRNPWRFSFDVDGGLLIADVGQGNWEEVNVTPSGTAAPVNYGWRITEGTHCYPPPTMTCNTTGLTLPPIEYDHSAGNCSVTGGYRYQGTVYPELVGQYIYGDYCSGRIWSALPAGGGAWTSSLILDTPYNISAFGEDMAGELYVLQHSTGAIYRVDASLMADADGDGCTDAEELGPDEEFGGQRDRFSQWDFYDVNGTAKIDALDVGLVRANFSVPNPTPPEDLIYDRSAGAQPWAPGPPDNVIDAIDIGLVRTSFNHSCQGFP